MSPIDYIEEGIRTGNWEKVCEGFERLTGQSLPMPIEKPGECRKTQDALRQIISIASEMLPTTEELLIRRAPKKKEKPARKSKKSAKKKKDDKEDNTLILEGQTNTPVTPQVGDMQLITNDPDPDEVARNEERASRARKNKAKLGRGQTMEYDAKCNNCEETFKSKRPDGEIGQKCPSCLKSMKKRSSDG